MLPATASAPAPDPAALHAAYLGHLQRTGRGNTAYWTAARTFFARWPDPAAWAAEPLDARLSANGATRPLITFLMLHGHLQPGYDYLLERKFSSLWRELAACPVGEDLARFIAASGELGFRQPVRDQGRVPGPGPAAGPDRAPPGPADHGRPGRVRCRVRRPAAAHRQRLVALQGRAEQHPADPVPPADPARAPRARRAGQLPRNGWPGSRRRSPTR